MAGELGIWHCPQASRHVGLSAVGLFGAHVVGRADDATDFGVHSGIAEARAGGFGEAEVNDFENRFLVHLADQHVRRLEIAMDDGFLMRVPRRPA